MKKPYGWLKLIKFVDIYEFIATSKNCLGYVFNGKQVISYHTYLVTN